MNRNIIFKSRKIVSRPNGEGYLLGIPRTWIDSYNLQGAKVGVEMTPEGHLLIRRGNDEKR